MTMNRSANKGFTLLEVLIAMVISSMLLAALMQAYAMLTQGWETRFDAFSDTLSAARKQHLLQRSIETMAPYNPPSGNAPEARGRVKEGPLFVGRERRMDWVTTMPVFGNDMTVARLALKEMADGTQAWVYAEATRQQMADIASASDWSAVEDRSWLIRAPVEDEVLRYYGVESLDRLIRRSPESGRRDQQGPEQAQWYDQYNASETQMLPRRVKIVSDEASTQSAFEIQTNSIRHAETDY